MTIAHKYPDDFEDMIYQSLLSLPPASNGITIPDLANIVKEKINTDVDHEVLFGFVRRMCQEGLAEKMSDNLYKAIKFDPTDLPVI